MFQDVISSMILKISFDIGEKIEDEGNKNINQKEEEVWSYGSIPKWNIAQKFGYVETKLHPFFFLVLLFCGFLVLLSFLFCI